MQLRIYQDKFPLFIMLKLKQVIGLTRLTIIKSYIKPFQRQLAVAVVTGWLLLKYLKDTRSDWLLFNSILM